MRRIEGESTSNGDEEGLQLADNTAGIISTLSVPLQCNNIHPSIMLTITPWLYWSKCCTQRNHTGNKPQSQHQDIGKHIFDFRGLLEPSVSTMWALRDYTATNGATRVVPGSHKWNRYRSPDYALETVPAVMPAGQQFLLMGRVFEGYAQHVLNQKTRE